MSTRCSRWTPDVETVGEAGTAAEALGMVNRRIGAELHLAGKTVKDHVSSLLTKPGMERRTQAAACVAKMHATEG